MKLLPYITIFLLAGIAFIGVSEMNDRNRVLQSEIEGLKKANEKERDSLENELLKTRDSLNIAFETIRQATKDREEAHERTQRMIKNYEKIIFISYSSDSARHRKLSELYPSYVIP